jgi:sialic acid synthase SpsE
MKKSRKYGRSLFAIADIKKNETITNENVRSIRPAAGMSPKYLPEILGKRATQFIKRGTPLQHNLISS